MKLKIEKMKSTLDCDDAFIEKLMVGFVEESTECVKLIQAAFASDDWNKVKGVAHKMRGACHIFEFDELIDVLRTIEQDCESETNLDTLIEKIGTLKNLHIECLDLINNYRNSLQK